MTDENREDEDDGGVRKYAYHVEVAKDGEEFILDFRSYEDAERFIAFLRAYVHEVPRLSRDPTAYRLRDDHEGIHVTGPFNIVDGLRSSLDDECLARMLMSLALARGNRPSAGDGPTLLLGEEQGLQFDITGLPDRAQLIN